jgi:hypothetical protein
MDLTRVEAVRWLLLIFQLPAKPAYLRVKIWRRLQALGAVTVKNSVYVLPVSEQSQEDFEWLLREITGGGGEGLICEARLVEGLSDDDVRALFGVARSADYEALAKEARGLTSALTSGTLGLSQSEARGRLAKLRADVERVAAIDFFGADRREIVEGLLRRLEAQLQEGNAMAQNEQQPAASEHAAEVLKGRT